MAQLDSQKRDWEELAEWLRTETKTGMGEPFDPFSIRIKGVEVTNVSEIQGVPKSLVSGLLGESNGDWSAISVPLDEGPTQWVIVLNPNHTLERQRVTLMEEYWHILNGHELSEIQDFDGVFFRKYNHYYEDEAYYLAAATLVPLNPLEEFLKKGKTSEEIASHFEVSRELVEYRLKRTRLWAHYKIRHDISVTS